MKSLLQFIADRVQYQPDGKLVWTYQDNRSDLVGKLAGIQKAGPNGYLYIKAKQKRIPVHRVVWFIHHGEVVFGLDHINRVKTDNRIENLRIANANQQMGNIRFQRGKSSKYRGVYYDKGRGCWCADIRFNGKRFRLGRFKNEDDAAIAYDNAAIDKFGEFANTNQANFKDLQSLKEY